MTNVRTSKIDARPDFSRASGLMYAAISFVGFVVTLIVMYGFYVGERISRLDEPLVDSAREINLEASAAMLWFEDFLDGRSSGDPIVIWQDVDRALWYLRAVLQKSELLHVALKGDGSARIQQLVDTVQEKLGALKQSSTEILAAEHASSEDLDRYKQLYTTFLAAVDQMEQKLSADRMKTLNRFRAAQSLLIFVSISLFILVALVYRRFDRQRTEYLQYLHEVNKRLENEMIVRQRTEEELQRAHEGLEGKVLERTSALRLANEKLTEEIVERQRAEEHLKNSKVRLQAVFDGISDPLILMAKDMRFIMMNRSAAKYFDIGPQEDAIGKECRQIVHRDCACDQCEIPPVIGGGLKKSFERNGLMNPLRVEQVTIYPVFGENGSPGDAIIRISDVTDAKMFERRLIQSERMFSLGILATSIAHEINNPNSFISFNIPILREYLQELLPLVDMHAEERSGFELFNMPYSEFKNDIFKLLNNVEHGSQRISAFVSNLRELSEFKEMKPYQRIEAKSTIDKAVEISRNKLKRSVKSFEVTIPEGLPSIFTDPTALEQILINLLINAAQAIDKEKSWVKPAVFKAEEDYVCFQVSDNGCGMEEETRRNIFEPFFTTKPLGEGTGLGLYVCQNLTENLGGRIEVDSQIGKGSTFKVFIPINKSRS
jgi:signal transduction histidine kinase